MRVIIIGGGIGGMSLAAALAHIEMDSVVLERAPELGEVGSGLGVLPGAVRALEALGVADTLLPQAAPLHRCYVASQKGRDLTVVDFDRLAQRIGRPAYVMRRALLHAELCARVRAEHVRTGSRVTRLEQDERQVRVYIEGQDQPITGDVAVGADGLRSVTRQHVLDDGEPRYAGETAFRGIAHYTLSPPDVAREVVGRGQRAAYYNLGGGRAYWWSTLPLPQGSVIPPADRHALLAERFRGWPFAIPDIFAATPAENILQNDLFDRPPAPTWSKGRIVLLGDAAHPTTPNLGQGACMAMEDAVVLARALASASSHQAAFAQYQEERHKRATLITKMSHWWGRVGLWESRAAAGLRNSLYWMTPVKVFEWVLKRQYGYDPGRLPEPVKRAPDLAATA